TPLNDLPAKGVPPERSVAPGILKLARLSRPQLAQFRKGQRLCQHKRWCRHTLLQLFGEHLDGQGRERGADDRGIQQATVGPSAAVLFQAVAPDVSDFVRALMRRL